MLSSIQRGPHRGNICGTRAERHAPAGRQRGLADHPARRHRMGDIRWWEAMDVSCRSLRFVDVGDGITVVSLRWNLMRRELDVAMKLLEAPVRPPLAPKHSGRHDGHRDHAVCSRRPLRNRGLVLVGRRPVDFRTGWQTPTTSAHRTSLRARRKHFGPGHGRGASVRGHRARRCGIHYRDAGQLGLANEAVSQSHLGKVAPRSRRYTPGLPCGTTWRLTLCVRRRRWPFSVPP
jgi:hypothetical protein